MIYRITRDLRSRSGAASAIILVLADEVGAALADETGSILLA